LKEIAGRGNFHHVEAIHRAIRSTVGVVAGLNKEEGYAKTDEGAGVWRPKTRGGREVFPFYPERQFSVGQGRFAPGYAAAKGSATGVFRNDALTPAGLLQRALRVLK
jgi:hypothetical protein